jgi:hypothetical protein
LNITRTHLQYRNAGEKKSIGMGDNLKTDADTYLEPMPDSTLALRKAPLCGATPFEMLNCTGILGQCAPGVGGVKTAQNLIGRVLEPGVRLVKLTGCLACQLAKLVAIGHVRKCPKYQIRTHV